MKLHDHRLLKTLASAGAALFALCATTLEASAGAVGGHVDITGSMLNVGGAPARFFLRHRSDGAASKANSRG